MQKGIIAETASTGAAFRAESIRANQTKAVRTTNLPWLDSIIFILLSFFESLLAILGSVTIRASLVPDFSAPMRHIETQSDSDGLEQIFGSNRGGDKFLGRFSASDITEMIKSSPICAKLESAGISDWYTELDLSDCFSHYAYIRSSSLVKADQYIAFIIVQNTPYSIPQQIKSELPVNVSLMYIKWLSLQNPRASFSATRAQLPNQRYPGGGFGRDFFAILIRSAKEDYDGIVNMPEGFHNAFLYAKSGNSQIEGFHFLNPEFEGHFQRLCKDLKGDIESKGLAAVSWAVFLGFLRCDGEQMRWKPSEQVCPISWRMWAYLISPSYLRKVSRAESRCGKYEINWEEAEKLLPMAKPCAVHQS